MRRHAASSSIARRAAAALSCAAAIVGVSHAGSVEPPLHAGGAFSVRVVSLKEARQAKVVRQQHDYSCGSAALATLLTHHYRQATTEQQVLQAMLAAQPAGAAERVRRDGFSMLDMKRHLESLGLQADGFEASVAELESAAVPAIAMVNEHGWNHFVVIKGVRDGRVLIADPARGLRAMPVAALEAMRATSILFVVGNRQDVAVFNSEADWALLPAAPVTAHAQGAGAMALSLPWRSGADF